MRLSADVGLERRAVEVDPLPVSRTIGDVRIEACEVARCSRGDQSRRRKGTGQGDRPSATRERESSRQHQSGTVRCVAASFHAPNGGRFSRPARTQIIARRTRSQSGGRGCRWRLR